MNFAQLLSNAGVASGAMRSAEENERVAQENQLKIEEQNRYAKLKRDAAALQFGTDQQAAAQPASNFDLGAALANLRANLRIGPSIDQEYIDVPPPPAAAPAAAPPVARTESVYVPPQLPAAGETVPVSTPTTVVVFGLKANADPKFVAM